MEMDIERARTGVAPFHVEWSDTWTSNAHAPAMRQQPVEEEQHRPEQDLLSKDHHMAILREAENLRKLYGEKRDALVSLLSGQLAFLKTEAQVVHGL